MSALLPRLTLAAVVTAWLLGGAPALAQTPPKPDSSPQCSDGNTVTANIVALNEPLIYNRMGAGQSSGMIFALQSDVVPNTFASNPPDSSDKMPTPDKLLPGQVNLRQGKRPRPIVLRVNKGQCLRVEFTNLLTEPAKSPQPPGTSAGVAVLGLEPVSATGEDAKLCKYSPLGQTAPSGEVVGPMLCNGALAGASPGSLVPPAAAVRRTNGRYYNIAYTYYAANEGSYLLYSAGQMTKVSGIVTQLSLGLFGSVNVQPPNSEWYRSQLTENEFSKGAVIQQTPKPYVSVNYSAVHAQDYERPDGTTVKAGTPVYRMVHNGLIIATDINAVITGPNHGALRPPAGKPADFCTNSKLWNPAYPNPCEPYREFTVIYHEDLRAQQAFPVAGGATYNAPYSDGADKFAMNYGIGGITSEILANRLPLKDLQASAPSTDKPQRGSGPSAECTECKFEEFFLSSWAGGDPAMVVDKPLNLPSPSSPATKVLYADDPSNVHHSYLGDHVRFRVLHAGQIHHIHHLHAHQWLFSQESSDSAYLDSQAIGPGSSYTQDIAYGGGGNRNRTPGDSIFHCHFYPHFAAGMWELWRVHDVFELGSKLERNSKGEITGVVDKGARALPDGEIKAGTPIPALMPLPTLAEAPLPAPACVVNGEMSGTGCKTPASATDNPGFPFFIPGNAGHRPPHPPMDFAVVTTSDGKKEVLNGGLPRHIVETSKRNKVDVPAGGFNSMDFSKELLALAARELPEEGTETERKAIAFHQKKGHESLTPDGKPARFLTNGLGPKPGAPFADPCGKDFGWAGRTRTYKAAAIQVDAVLTKKGWHYPQQRMLSLWSDVEKYFHGQKPPEPLFIRANSGECVEYWHTNLVPNEFELDDFEVRTPTDILGQHIHLVKFDVLASDGAANGWNYEDGTFSPDEVVERINAINKAGGLASYDGKSPAKPLRAVPPPKQIFGEPPPDQDWEGAQTTVQRWLADPVVNNQGVDRTLRTVFTHDHYGPSTHQQAGLYAGLLVEPANSMWLDPETGARLGSRDDGSPTRFQANIVVDPALPRGARFEPYREFAMMFQDEQLAYQKGSKPLDPEKYGWADPANALNANGYDPELALPQPNLVTNGGIGVTSINYRAEPLPFRVNKTPDGKCVESAKPQEALNNSHVFRSITRCDPDLNKQPGIYNNLTEGVNGTDPYTPLLRAYQGDNVQVRLLVGAHINVHTFSINGVNWLFEPSDPNSGYRGAQTMGLSEHYELLFKVPKTGGASKIADYIYKADNADPYLTTGLWGLLRGYGELQRENGKLTLQPLPNNKNPANGAIPQICSDPKRIKKFNVVASTSQQLLKNRSKGQLVFWPRGSVAGGGNAQPWVIQNALMYVLAEDLDSSGQLKEDRPVEPLVLRAAAGDCVEVTLTNRIDPTSKLFQTPFNYWGSITGVKLAGNTAPAGDYLPNMTLSADVGLHPQLVAYDVTSSDGENVGKNPVQTVSPPTLSQASSSTAANTPVQFASLKQPGDVVSERKYLWYMGKIENGKPRPVEFGAVNLIPSDQLGQPALGMSAALVVEPENTKAVYEDPNSRASATIELKDGRRFREFVTIFQGSLQFNADTLPMDGQQPQGQALNYGTEPFSVRYAGLSGTTDISCGLSDRLVQPMLGSAIAMGDPSTPVFSVPAGMEVRFRMLHAAGAAAQAPAVPTIANHAWQYSPYQKGSTVIALNPLSDWTGSQMGHQPGNHFDAVIPAAGGKFGVPGDYVIANFNMNALGNGSWGLLRVGNGDDTVAITQVIQSGSNAVIQGRNGVQARGPNTGKFAQAVSLYGRSDCSGAVLAKAQVDQKNGLWKFDALPLPKSLCIRSDGGGMTRADAGSTNTWAFNVPGPCGEPTGTQSTSVALKAQKPKLTPAQLEEIQRHEDDFRRKSGRPPLRRK